MSQTMAEKLKRKISGRSVVAYLILGALVLVFVLFDFRQGGAGMGAVARVNNTQISILDFQEEVQRIQQYYSSLFGGNMDLGPQRQMLQQQALDNLIRQELVHQAVKDEGMYATDGEVREYILKQIPVFQENGVFQRDRYSLFLESRRWSPAEFENKIRKDIALTRSRRLFDSSSKLSQTEVQKLQELKTQKMNISYVKLNTADLIKKQKISDSEIRQALKDPEFDKKVAAEFKATESEYSQNEEVRAQHILLKVTDPAQDAEVFKKIKELKSRSQKEDFGQLAAKMSEDPGSKMKNGDLGFFARGRMVPEFDAAAFSMKVGEISAPIKTQFGYHLIKVTDKKEAKQASLESSRMKVAEKLLAGKKVHDIVQQMEVAVQKRDEKLLSTLVSQLGVSWLETGMFDLSVDMIPGLNGESLSTAAFEVNSSQPLLNRLVTEGADRYILRWKAEQTVASAADEKLGENAARRRSSQSFESWINHYKKMSKVVVNQKVLQN